MVSRIGGRKTCGGLFVKAESFIVVRIAQNEDSGPAFTASEVHRSLNKS